MNELKWFTYLKEGDSNIGKSISDVLALLEEFGNHTWIFLDTESTGMEARENQLIEIGAIAVDPRKWFETSEVIDTFNVKIKLNDDSKKLMNTPDSKQSKSWHQQQKRLSKPLKKPQDVLSMTKYGDSGTTYLEEQDALEKFEEFIQGFKDPLLVAQNATHDMSFLNGRKMTRMPRMPIFDTYPLIKLHLIPILLKIQNIDVQSDEQDVKKQAIDILAKIKSGEKSYSASLGKVGPAMGFSVENWHSAVADVRLMMDVFKKSIDILSFAQQRQLNIRPEYDKAVSQHRKSKKK